IIGMTELVLDTELTTTQREYLAMVRDSGEALLFVINDILDFSKIEAGEVDLDRTQFSLRGCLRGTIESLALPAHTKGLELACHIAPGIPDALLGDPGRLRQVVVNLVGNAIKFTAEGEVVLDVQPAREPDSNGDTDEVVLHFLVADTGIGISPEKR